MADSVAEIEARLLANPDDDAAWEAYAPHLFARGDPRGEYVALAALASTPERRAEIAAWTRKQRGCRMPFMLRPGDCEFRRGFLVGATFRIAGRADAREFAAVIDSPHYGLLGSVGLRFDGLVAARALAPLAGADLSRLRTLRSCYHFRGNQLARALGQQSSLNLHTLDLRHSALGDDGLLALAGCRLRGLRSLHLQHNRFTARGLAALANSPHLTGLERLDLRHNPIGSEGAAALAESPHLGKLTALLLYGGELGRDGVRALAASATLPRDLVRYWRAQDRA